ncbi:MAG TPA: glycoside hydrolase family 3 N-terminal domain-containing protein [Solirubrobacterales bacterium]|nr:glycoside hydrolase family 3 N-terminal domain-containing protein [Solirubrobacterales bacterium]
MERTLARRRRGAAVILACVALAAFAGGATVGDGSSEAKDKPGLASTLSAAQLAGERIVVGVSGTAVSPGLHTAIHQGQVAGVVLFAGNFPTRAAGARLIKQLQAIPRPRKLRSPLLIIVDQEGGQVKRLSGAPTASAAEMGARGAAFSREQGARTAANLRDVGVNIDLAPVLDVARPGGVIAETERGFGSNSVRAGNMAIAFGGALQSGGVGATGKHFPGFGAARENTDFSVERIDLSKQELRQIDEAPYQRFSEMGGVMVMLSTAIYPAFSDRPAAFTRAIATAELRHRLGFEGVTISDALETPAVEHFGTPAEAAVAGAAAGTDLLLYTRLGPAMQARRALLAKLRSGGLERAAFVAAVERVLALRAELPL